MQWKGTAVVTGAGSGIGRALTRAFAERGLSVAALDIDGERAAETAALIDPRGGRTLPLQCDVASRESVAAAGRRIRDWRGDVTVVCNNAGVALRRRGTHAAMADWQWVVGVNLWGVIHGIHEFLPDLLGSPDGGHIVNTASILGLVPSGVSALYSATKYGVVGLSESLRSELAGTGVGVSVLCPGVVSTTIFASERVRPDALRTATSADELPPTRTYDFSPPLEPDAVAALVLEGIDEDRLFIFTDPRTEQMVDAHHREVMRDFAPVRPA
jgi:Short-chain alcohol dehydrogenase of unknown specificity